MLAKRLNQTAFLILGIAAAGVTYGYGNFVKFKIGPLFTLETLYVAWFATAAIAALQTRRTSALRNWKGLRPALSYFIWGLSLLLSDLIFRSHAMTDSRTFARVIQHGIIFVYPLFWMAAGHWAASTNERYSEGLALATLAAAALPNLFGANIENWAVGPLLAVPMMWCLLEALRKKDGRYALAFAALAALVFYPFWFMWWQGVGIQRTTFGILLFIMSAVSILAGASFRKKAPIALAAAAFTLAGGFFAISTYTAKPIAETAKNAFQHTEDRPSSAEAFPIQLHARRLWWNDTLREWKKSPIVGVGFIPELPVWLYQKKFGASLDLKNDWNTAQTYERLPGRAPVSGPHNSYLSVLTRTGVIGLILLLAVFVGWFKAVKAWAWDAKPKALSIAKLLILVIPVNGALYALLNTGFEGPQNCAVMWLFAGICLGFKSARSQAR